MKDLTAVESERLFSKMISGEMPKQKIRETLLALKNKGETTDEIFGAVQALRAEMISFKYEGSLIDVCGTGGDGLKTLNISTAVSFVLAACGIKVVKHGNKAISSLSGSSDVLLSLGVNITPALAKRTLDETNFCYFHAPDYHPALKNLADIRRDIKERTIFNLLGPLLNPARPKYQLVGVYSSNLLRTYAEVLRRLGSKKAWVVHGTDGLDEVSISSDTHVSELAGGAIDNFFIDPETAGLAQRPLDEIKGGDADYNAKELEDLLKGKTGTYRDIVLLNAAAGLIVMDKVHDLKEGVELAAKALDSGGALKVLKDLRIINK